MDDAKIPVRLSRDEFIERVLGLLEECSKLGPNHWQMGPVETKLVSRVAMCAEARLRGERIRPDRPEEQKTE